MTFESHYLSMIESLSALLVKQGEEIFSLRDAQRGASNAPGDAELLAAKVSSLMADNDALTRTLDETHAELVRVRADHDEDLERATDKLDETQGALVNEQAELAKVRAEYAQVQKDLERATSALVSFIGNPDSFAAMIANIRATEVTYFDSHTQSERYNWIPRIKVLREAFPGHLGLKNCKDAVMALTLHDEGKVRAACASFAWGPQTAVIEPSKTPTALSYDQLIERSSTHTDDPTCPCADCEFPLV